MIRRFAEEIVFSDIFSRQMRFIAGPRQSGKTTLARNKLARGKTLSLYYNWDSKIVRDRYRGESDFLGKDILTLPKTKKYWACFDEIHKMPKWKNILKGYFDVYEDKVNLIVTGSARLDMFRRAGDSLAGRYFMFKLNPFILAEVLDRDLQDILPLENSREYVEKLLAHNKFEQTAMEKMLQFSGFPEPFLKGNTLFAKKWHEYYLERVVKEDIRDLSAIHQIEKVLDLLFMLPFKIAAPLSINALREDLELNFNTVKNYINYLITTYAIFSVNPYTRKNSRLVKKERKVYFYDFTVIKSAAERFENFVALELRARIDLWNDILEDKYDLLFVRGREGNETDFLITRNTQPYLLCEAKLAETNVARHHYLHAKLLGNIPFVQVVKAPDILRVEQNSFYVVSASRFFS